MSIGDTKQSRSFRVASARDRKREHMPHNPTTFGPIWRKGLILLSRITVGIIAIVSLLRVIFGQ